MDERVHFVEVVTQLSRGSVPRQSKSIRSWFEGKNLRFWMETDHSPDREVNRPFGCPNVSQPFAELGITAGPTCSEAGILLSVIRDHISVDQHAVNIGVHIGHAADSSRKLVECLHENQHGITRIN